MWSVIAKYLSERKWVLVAQSCPTFCDHMDWGPTGSSVHGILQARILEWVAIPFEGQGIFQTQGSNPGLLHCRQILYHLGHCAVCLVWLFVTPWTVAHQAPQAPLSIRILQARILEWAAMPSFRGSSQTRDWTQVSCSVGRFFTVWATRESQEYWSG